MKRTEMAEFLRKFEQELSRFRLNPVMDLERSGKLTEVCKHRLVIYAHEALPWGEDDPRSKEELEKERMGRGSPELVFFTEQVGAQIKGAGCETGREFVRAFPGKHIWGMMDGYESCAFCGVCKSRDPAGNGPCKGIARISLR